MKSANLAKSPMVRRSIYIKGRTSSVSLEDQFWEALREIASERGSTWQDLVTSIKAKRRQGNLSSTIRVFVLEHYRPNAERMKRREPRPYIRAEALK